jgi:DNA anti-recombination protein RmuC
MEVAPLTKQDLEEYQKLIDASNAKVVAVQKEVAEQLRGITQQLVLLAKSNEDILTTLRDLVAKPLVKAVEDSQSDLETAFKTRTEALSTTFVNKTDSVKSEVGECHGLLKKLDGRLESMEKAAITSRTNWVIVINLVVATLTPIALMVKTFWPEEPHYVTPVQKTSPAPKKKTP